MEAALFAKILSDQAIIDLKKMKYKYPDADLQEFIALLKDGIYKTIPLKDFNGQELVYLAHTAELHVSAVKLLLTPQSDPKPFGTKAMEEEIASTLTIENIDFSRESVRKILNGYAPADESEQRIYGLKKGLDFISNSANIINEANIHTLYQLAIGDSLEKEENRLLPDHFYRHDRVYVVGREVEHTGLPEWKLPQYMNMLTDFIERESSMNDLLKAAVIHFYVGYLHPYFDGNGRMARLMHLWYLVRAGYTSALFIPFSRYVEKSRRAYYHAYSLVERNLTISGVLDVTPFLVYFIEQVYNKLSRPLPEGTTMQAFQRALQAGQITEKEKELWHFVLSAYGGSEFSTKRLEKDFGQAAYATIRKFVMKFEELGLLKGQKYGNRVKYRV